MNDAPSWKDLIDMVSNTINNVDENAKRESDKLHSDICALRKELNDTRSDIMLNRSEMAILRNDMATFKDEIKESDEEQCDQLKEIQIKSGIFESTRAKIVTVVLTILSAIGALLLKILEII